ncbi:hypothetical protein PN466_09920, partial [Roseofilum reptotaenium CS-1145]|uniref:hypothetical protein n=1 Tax=Roseofilum reptotaenium TaxID=1233427 RepID=UPI0023310B26
QSSPLFTALGGTSSINWYTAYKKISRNNITLTGDNVRGVDLSPIDNCFWVYIELNESFTDQLMLGLGSYSWHRVDVDVRQILTYDSSLSERNINDVMAYFGTSPSPTPTPTPVPMSTKDYQKIERENPFKELFVLLERTGKVG